MLVLDTVAEDPNGFLYSNYTQFPITEFVETPLYASLVNAHKSYIYM